MKKSGILVTAVALASVTMTAQAAIKLNATRTGVFSSHPSQTSVILPLNNAGAKLLSFSLASSKKMVLTYSAVCAITGAGYGWIDIDIVVNGVTVEPTAGADDALCSMDTTPPADVQIRAAITVQIQGRAGNNVVYILARPTSSVGPINQRMLIGNSALLVFD